LWLSSFLWLWIFFSFSINLLFSRPDDAKYVSNDFTNGKYVLRENFEKIQVEENRKEVSVSKYKVSTSIWAAFSNLRSFEYEHADFA
jgi:hypothetical protein